MKKKSKIIYRLLKPVIFTLFKIVYRPSSQNKENIPSHGAVIIIGNHRHALDPLMIGMSTRRVVNFLAKKELHQVFGKTFFKALGTIPIDLNGKNKDASEIIAEVLQNNEAVGMFPEAKRNYTNELLLPFKYGAVSLAQKTGALIIPCAIIGNYRPFRKGPVIIIGKPVSVDKMNLDEANYYITECVREILIENIGEVNER